MDTSSKIELIGKVRASLCSVFIACGDITVCHRILVPMLHSLASDKSDEVGLMSIDFPKGRDFQNTDKTSVYTLIRRSWLVVPNFAKQYIAR